MKLSLIRVAAVFAALLVAPARAEQASIVGPLAGPKTMTEVMTAVNAAMLAIQSCNSGASAPSNGVSGLPTENQCWADTTSNPILYKRYDGASWVTFGALNTSTHVWTPYRNGSPIAAVATSSSAADLTTGTLPAARLPTPTASSLGGVQSKTCSASQWLNEVTTSGVPNCAQPNFTDLAGTASLAQLPAFSGMSAASAAADADTFPTNQGAGNLKQTLAAVKTWIKAWIVKADVGLGNVDNTSDATKWGATKTLLNTTFNCGSTGNVCTVRLATDITGFGTGIATALGVNVGSAGAPVLFNGAGGTPSSIVLTNATGTASGLTAGNVTTNANLTGEVTSVGNATTVTNSSVIAKLLTAFSAGAGTVSSSDSILSAFQKVVGNIALKANSASPTLTGAVDAQGTVKLSAFVTATQITANQNNYTATDGSNTCGTKTSLRISSDASRNVTGLSCSQAEGDIRIIHNVGGQNVVLTNQDTNSTAANRFLFGGDLTLLPDYSVTVKYDGVASRWRAITTAGAGGGGGGVTSVTVAAGSGIAATGTCSITTTGTCTVGLASPGDVPLLAMALSDATSSYVSIGSTFADNFKSFGMVDTSGATNLTTAESGYLKPTTTSPSFSTTASSTVAGDTGAFSGNTVRQIVNAAQLSLNGNGQVRVSIKAGSSGATIARVYVAMAAAAGDTYDFQSTPVQLLNGGSAGAVLSAAATGTWTAPFNLEASKNLVIAYELTTGSLPFQTTLTGWQAWFKSGTDAATVNATGYTVSQASLGVPLVEYSALPSSNNLTVASQILPAPFVPAAISGYARVVPTDALTLGTDFFLDVSRDGSTWATGGTLSLLYTDGGTSVLSLAAVNVSGQPSGSSPRWRIRSANNKAFKVDGVALVLAP